MNGDFSLLRGLPSKGLHIGFVPLRIFYEFLIYAFPIVINLLLQSI